MDSKAVENRPTDFYKNQENQFGHKQPTPSMHGRIGGALYYAKPALRVGPYLSSFGSNGVISITYFDEPAIFKSL
jgi:hypothetical protein